MTEREEQIETETVNSIEETVESEYDYRDFMEEERERRREEQIEQDINERVESVKDESTEDSIGERRNPELDRFTGRITEVSFDSQSNNHTITFEDKKGGEYTATVDAGLPEDSSNKYVRLCEWLDVNPAYLAELRGKEIPITRKENTTQIDFPPVSKRLNPYAYKYKRVLGRGSRRIESGEMPSTLSGYLGTALVTILPAVGLFLSLVTMAWINWATNIATSLFINIIGWLLVVPTALVAFVFGVISMSVYWILARHGIIKTGQLAEKGLSRTIKFLFPEE